MKTYFGYAPAILVPRLISALIILLFSRILSPTEIGLYSLVIVFGEYLDTICLRWIRVGYTRLYYEYAAKGIQLERTVLAFSVPGLVISVIFAFSYPLFDSELSLRWGSLLALYVLANCILYQGLQYLRVQKKTAMYVGLECTRSVAGFAIAWVLNFLLAPHYEWLLIGTQGTTAIAAVILLVPMLRIPSGSAEKWEMLKNVLKYSLPLTVSFFLAGTALVIDRILLQKIHGVAELGVYAVSYQLARPSMDILFNIINVGGFPKLIAVYEQDGEDGARRVLYQKAVAIAFVTLPVLTFFVVCSPQIASTLLSDQYALLAPSLLVLIGLASFARGVERFLVDQVFHIKKTTADTIWNLIPAIIAVTALSLILIPEFGARGAAISALVGSWVGLAVALWRAQHRMKFYFLGKEVYFIFLASVLGGAALFVGTRFFGTTGWIASGLMCLVLYPIAMSRLGILRYLKD